MRLNQLLQRGDFLLSIEVFPPKTSAGDEALFENLSNLMKYRPSFVSCTYGAGGSTRDRTIDLCRTISRNYEIPTTAHLTCVGSTKADLRETLAALQAAGVKNIMALRGDPPQGSTEFKPVEGGLTYASELVSLIKSEFPELGIGIAAYPEMHPEATCAKDDLNHFITKANSGADAAFTQLFFVNDNYFKFVKQCRELGLELPIIPGIMPITEYARIKRITALCKAVFPEELASQLEAVQDDTQAQFDIGVKYAIQQCQQLIDQGVPGIHFYALNKSHACERILDELKM
jgi:methylenetetrahydrofolate reductase (NADPH)